MNVRNLYGAVTNVTFAAAVFICVRPHLRFISARAFLPMVLFIVFPFRSVVVLVGDVLPDRVQRGVRGGGIGVGCKDFSVCRECPALEPLALGGGKSDRRQRVLAVMIGNACHLTRTAVCVEGDIEEGMNVQIGNAFQISRVKFNRCFAVHGGACQDHMLFLVKGKVGI